MSNDTAPPSTPSSQALRKNRATMIGSVYGPRTSADALAETHALACEVMANAEATAPGYRLYWSRDRVVRWMDLPVGGAYAILGRHSACDAVLADEDSLSLRHLLATTVTLSDGIGFRLLDLQTAVPFYLADEAPQRSIMVFGAIAARVGRSIVGAVPIEETVAGLRPVLGDLPEANIVKSHEAPRSFRSVPAGTPYRDPAVRSASRITRVSSIPSASSISMSASSVQENAAWASDAFARVILQREHRVAAVDLTQAQLELGVLLGRAERCFDQGLRAVLDHNISRGHVLLLHDQRGLEAFDLCSTQGTFQSTFQGGSRNRARIRRAQLRGERHEELVMGWNTSVALRVRLREKLGNDSPLH